MEPLLAEELAVESYSPDEGVGVVAARENAVGRSVGAVEVGHGSKMSLAAVAIAGIVFLAASVIPTTRQSIILPTRLVMARLT